jgi:predicted RNA-binding Zn-ribbon protein involved in translation (DUF1610 family)
MADRHVQGLRQAKQEHKSRLARLVSYQCPDCGEWHVGHDQTKTQRLARIA